MREHAEYKSLLFAALQQRRAVADRCSWRQAVRHGIRVHPAGPPHV